MKKKASVKRKPREWWIVIDRADYNYVIHCGGTKGLADAIANTVTRECIHVVEVLPKRRPHGRR
jgi:hypothetical protein